jgi:hypothetical protein
MKTRNLSLFALSSAVAGILAGAALNAGCSENASAASKTAERTEHNGCSGKEAKEKNSCSGANGCSSKEKH